MSSEPDPERLRALEKRLEVLKGKPKEERSQTAKGFSQGEIAYRMVIELATGILVGVGIGYGLDVLMGTLPVFLAIFSMVGFAAGVRTMMGTARQIGDKATAAAAAEREREDGRGDGH
jgi:ATP synthase protein I